MAFAVIFFFVLPYILLLSQVKDVSFSFFDNFYWVFENTFLQAFFSALISMVLGVYSALGLIHLKERYPRQKVFVDFFVLLPSMLPVLFVLLSFLNLAPSFPFGIWSVVLIHSFINIGVVAVSVMRVFENKIGSFAEWALIEGASRWQFMNNGIRKYLGRDIFLIFFFVFSICFSSFAVPLIVGGERGVTVEVLIYEKIRIYKDWGAALGLSAIQASFIFLISFGTRPSIKTLRHKPVNLEIVADKWSWLLPCGISTIVVAGLFPGFLTGYSQFLEHSHIQQAFVAGLIGSLSVGLGVGFVLLALFFLVAFVYPNKILEKFLNGFVAPSAVLTGFGLLIFFESDKVSMQFIKIIVGLCMILFPILYRLQWDSSLASLLGQIRVARTLGASWFMILNDITIPQLAKMATFLSALGAFWAIGDFALSSVVADGDYTLALAIKSLISHYGLDLAVFFSWALLFLGLMLFLFFRVIGHVLSRKSL